MTDEEGDALSVLARMVAGTKHAPRENAQIFYAKACLGLVLGLIALLKVSWKKADATNILRLLMEEKKYLI